MRTWQDFLTLLSVVDKTRDHPNLKRHHDVAMALLNAVDPESLGFPEAPVEELPEYVEHEEDDE